MLSLALLERLALSGDPIGVPALAREFETSKATVYRHLQALAAHGFVRQDPATQRYEGGVKLFMLGEALRDRFRIATIAADTMTRLRDQTGLAVTVTKLVDEGALVVALLHGRTVGEFSTRVGTALDLHASAHGKLAMAFGPPSLLYDVMRGPLKAWTPDTIQSPAVLEREVLRVRRHGWATGPNEIVWGVNALAAPVFDHRGDYAGAIAMVGSVKILPAQPQPQQIEWVCEAARQISAELGYQGDLTGGDRRAPLRTNEPAVPRRDVRRVGGRIT